MYRIYFLDRRGAIQAREEFDAPSDGDAVIIGSLVADVCSETYASYEIWSFNRRVVEPLASIPAISLAEISEDFQEQVLKLEDSMQRSRWAVAKSQRLIEKSNALRAAVSPRIERRLSGVSSGVVPSSRAAPSTDGEPAGD